MNKKASLIWICALLYALVFIMLYKSPFRLDDLTWGGRIGLDRLNNHFANYNGRYLGNMVVIVLTRLPSIIRVNVQILVLLAIIMCAFILLERSLLATGVFVLFFFLMPLTVLTQTVAWVAGFSNYVFSTLFVMTVMVFDLQILDGRRYKPWTNALFLCVVFAGQFFLETASLCVIVLSVGVWVLYFGSQKKMSKLLLLQMLIAIGGAAVMFSNGAYLSAIKQDGGTYKAIEIGNLAHMIREIMKTYRDTVAYKWFGMNVVLNLVLSATVILFCANAEGANKKLTLTGCAFLALFVYDLTDGDKAKLLSREIMSIVSVLFVLYLLAVTFWLVQERRVKRKIVIMLCTSVVLMLPLNAVSPIGDRCFLNTYVLWATIAAEFLRIVSIKEAGKSQNRSANISVLVGAVLIVYLCGILQGQSLSWKIEKMRMDAIAQCKETNATELVIPRVPDASMYCFGANLSGKYWLGNYKEYYGIDLNTDIIFVDYKDYIG